MNPHTALPDTQPPELSWDTEQLFFSGTAFFDDLLSHIAMARYSISIETYIFDHDVLGLRVVEALRQANRRGVRIRVLMDGVGTYINGAQMADALEEAGIDVKIFRPLPWQIHHYRRSSRQGNAINKLLYFISRINQRDHRKVYIIDNSVLWSGSFNISACHLPVTAGGQNWRDYGVRVTGANVHHLSAQFDDYWLRRPPDLGKGLFRSYWHTLSDWSRRRRNQLLLHKIQHAQQRIWLVAAYFAPAASVVEALQDADRRGVDVKILVAGKSDIPLFPLLTATYYADLLKAGVEVFEYTASVLHAKALLIDDFCLVGSTNFNHRSYLHDLELDIVVDQPASLAALEQQMIADRASSIRINDQLHGTRYWRWLGWLPRLLRYWM